MSFEATEKTPGAGPRAPLWCAVLALATLVTAHSALADEFDQFTHARNAFEAGDYAVAASRFEALLEGGLRNPALILECHKLAAVAYLFVDDREWAEHHFIELLTISPDYTLDPMMFPIDVLDFFTEVKQKNDDRIAELARARAAEEARRRKAEEARRRSEAEKLKRNVYVERTRRQNLLFVAFLPLGIGQFQNGDNVKGGLLMGSQLLLGATALTTYILHENLRPRSREPFSSPQERADYEQLESVYRITNRAALVGFGAVAVVGIIDALYNFEPETVTWRKAREDEVPEHLKPQAESARTAVYPLVGEASVGLVVSGEF
ncbi:MAG: hypothetical protein JRI55_41045 [Deltaproteobacteria bacterium]|jgi:tetratricopeptide (TPR) repeat protein|nr:hypothetical protein [Deltaproteobacteria bacterium]